MHLPDFVAAVYAEHSPALAAFHRIAAAAGGDAETAEHDLAVLVAGLLRDRPDASAASHLGCIRAQLDRIEKTQEKLMSEQQQDIAAATAFDTQLDADLKALAGQVTAGQQALDTAIANLNAKIAAGQPVDTSELVAAQAVLAGDQPTLDAAVAALNADPNITPVAAPAPSDPSSDGTTPGGDSTSADPSAPVTADPAAASPAAS